MIWRVRLGKFRITFTIAPVTDVAGVNSNLPDGKHILMWDFDSLPIEFVERTLYLVQLMFELPRIYILNTGKPNHYIAYCFVRRTWQQTVEILAATKGIDWNYFKYGVYRGHFTLRITPKSGRAIQAVCCLPSNVPEQVKLSELDNFTRYETLDR